MKPKLNLITSQKKKYQVKKQGSRMDKEKIIRKIRTDKLDLVHIPSTSSDQERKKLIQDFIKKIDTIKTTGESALLFVRP